MRKHLFSNSLRFLVIFSSFLMAAASVDALEKPRGPEIKKEHNHDGGRNRNHRNERQRESRADHRREHRQEHRRGHQSEHRREHRREQRREERREHRREQRREERHAHRRRNHGHQHQNGIVGLHNEVVRQHRQGLHILGDLLTPPHISYVVHSHRDRHHHRHGRTCDHKSHRRVKRGYYFEDRWGDCYWVQRRHGRDVYDSVPRNYCR